MDQPPNSDAVESHHLLPRQRQRRALSELVRLATESARTESEIEAEYASAVAAEKERHERSLWALEQRAEAQRAQIREKLDERVTRAQQQFAQVEVQLRAQDRQARQKINVEYQSAASDIKRKYEQAVWLADSMLEGVQNQLRAEVRKADEDLESELNAVAEVLNQSVATLHLYGQPNLAQVPSQAVLPSGDAPARPEYERHLERAKLLSKRLARLPVPRLFVGLMPFVLTILLMCGAGAAAHFLGRADPTAPPDFKRIGLAVGGALAACMVLGVVLLIVGKRQVRDAFRPLADELELARQAAQRQAEQAAADRKRRAEQAQRKRDEEVQQIKDRLAPLTAKATSRRDEAIRVADRELADKLSAAQGALDQAKLDAEAAARKHEDELARRLEQLKAEEQSKHEAALAENERRYRQRSEELLRRLDEGLRQTEAPTASRYHSGASGPRDWTDPKWKDWQPTRQFAPAVTLGEIRVDLRQLAGGLPGDREPKIQLPPPFTVPVILAFPQQASLLVETDRAGRARGIETLQMTMVRLLTSLPPGRVKFTMIDPVGLGQNFAGFMHLADYDDSLVGGRIWTESDQIDQRLANLTDHMETVIQKYLRNEFETIDDYNDQAGELAEPYRFLVIADFPVGFTEEACRRLSSIATSGARCGVYTLIAMDTRHPVPSGIHLEDLESHSLTLVQSGDGFVWKDDVFAPFPLALDAAPDEPFLTDVLHKVGRGAKEANRVEVPFESIAPGPEEFWSRNTRDDFAVPIGRTGATRLQSLRLGRGVAQHVLIAGKTGSGKSTLLHAIVTNAAMWFPPEEIEFYLVDFKKGVEFKTYAALELPHARAIAVESDREFGLSVLQRLDAKLTRRGELFRKAGVQDLSGYRQTAGATVMPRTLLVIDEFQEFFSEDDKLAQDAALLLDRLVRQGRAFGIHVLLGSQTIGGSSGLGRATLGQMAVRIALQCSEADSQIILGDANTAARLLGRPGEAIYNDAGGLVEANSPFQIAWLPDEQRERYLAKVREKLGGRTLPFEPPAVFEGNAPANLRRNQPLAALLREKPVGTPATLLAFVGDPVAIKDPTAIPLRRQSGANLLVIGQQDEQALAILESSLLSLAAQLPSGGATVYLLDGAAVDSPLFGQLQKLAERLPLNIKPVEYRAVGQAMQEISDELKARSEAEQHDHPPVFVVIYGLQRFRQLRKGDDDFSFSLTSSEEKAASPGKQFADLLRDGPALGMHTLAWVDTQASIERTLDRGSLREFDHRVLFQMSANDSSSLIDSPAANKLGFYRAIAYSEEQGIMEKFRPYAPPPTDWLETAIATLRARETHVS